MKPNLQLVAMSLFSGIGTAIISVFLELDQAPSFWFLFGSVACYYSFGYTEALSRFWGWWRTQPNFKGLKYWIKIAFKIEK